jgi:hypothetical protein
MRPSEFASSANGRRTDVLDVRHSPGRKSFPNRDCKKGITSRAGSGSRAAAIDTTGANRPPDGADSEFFAENLDRRTICFQHSPSAVPLTPNGTENVPAPRRLPFRDRST